jgi:hypothetical protein
MGVVERYHAPLRAAYLKLKEEIPQWNKQELLSSAVKATNDSVNLEGLIPTLLVFGALPKLLRGKPALSQIERARSAEQAREEVSKEFANRKIAFGLRYSGPSAKEMGERLSKISVMSSILVWRDKSKVWERMTLISVDVDTGICVIQTPSGRRLYSLTAVKPMPMDQKDIEKSYN